jgi:hypothetical protein
MQKKSYSFVTYAVARRQMQHFKFLFPFYSSSVAASEVKNFNVHTLEVKDVVYTISGAIATDITKKKKKMHLKWKPTMKELSS